MNTVVVLGCLGITLIIIGLVVVSYARTVVMVKERYDGPEADEPLRAEYEACRVSELLPDEASTCEVTLKAPADMDAPVFFYYELSHFYQNHKRYSTSLDHAQLMGATREKLVLRKCDPLKTAGDRSLNPCGLLANSFFTDVVTYVGDKKHTLKEDDIAWPMDRGIKFRQPETFAFAVATPADEAVVAECLGSDCPDDFCEKYGILRGCQGYECQGGTRDDYRCEAGQYAVYYYERPEDFKSASPAFPLSLSFPRAGTLGPLPRYLHESFPDNISPLVGVEDEHFMVWMRTAALSHFRKLYGTFDTDIKKGEEMKFSVDARFYTRKFGGSKWLVLTTRNPMGCNAMLGYLYVGLGAICFCLVAFFATLQRLHPRVVGDLDGVSNQSREEAKQRAIAKKAQ